jgi:hypothetical protein
MSRHPHPTSENPNSSYLASESHLTGETERPSPAAERHPARVSVALLSDAEIAGLNQDELNSMIDAADIKPVDRRTLRSLHPRSERDWKRLAHVTRTACRAYVEKCNTRQNGPRWE